MPPKKKARVSKASASSGKVDDNERSSAASRRRKAAAPVAKTGKGFETAGSPVFTHWLMKSEPESRFENGVDVKFGIEDLKALPDQTGCWDGVRNYQARNFMRQMKEGQQAFFYHSNCKEPGIAGIMTASEIWNIGDKKLMETLEELWRPTAPVGKSVDWPAVSRGLHNSGLLEGFDAQLCFLDQIVKEAYVDHTQFDKKDVHYDASSKPDNPKWSMVDVRFQRMLKRFLPLSEMKKYHLQHRASGGPLKDMALFTRARLSIQPLTSEEFDFILSLEDKELL